MPVIVTDGNALEFPDADPVLYKSNGRINHDCFVFYRDIPEGFIQGTNSGNPFTNRHITALDQAITNKLSLNIVFWVHFFACGRAKQNKDFFLLGQSGNALIQII